LPEGAIGPDDPEFDGPADVDFADDRPGQGRQVVVIVFAPRDPDPKRFRFRRDELVGTAAATAAEAFNYDQGGTPSFRMPDGTVLDRTITLEAAGVRTGMELELVDVGGGV
jgi:hypothetical protein